jgi:hypothetical protein
MKTPQLPPAATNGPLGQKPPVIDLICACCYGYTRGRQWYNRDTGYGLCPNCVDWLKGKNYPAASLKSDYGIENYHYFTKDQEPK